MLPRTVKLSIFFWRNLLIQSFIIMWKIVSKTGTKINLLESSVSRFRTGCDSSILVASSSVVGHPRKLLSIRNEIYKIFQTEWYQSSNTTTSYNVARWLAEINYTMVDRGVDIAACLAVITIFLSNCSMKIDKWDVKPIQLIKFYFRSARSELESVHSRISKKINEIFGNLGRWFELLGHKEGSVWYVDWCNG